MFFAKRGKCSFVSNLKLQTKENKKPLDIASKYMYELSSINVIN
jgi:hypothetical protein